MSSSVGIAGPERGALGSRVAVVYVESIGKSGPKPSSSLLLEASSPSLLVTSR